MSVGLDPEIREEEYEFYSTYQMKDVPLVKRILLYGLIGFFILGLIPVFATIACMLLCILLPIAAIYTTVMVIGGLAVFLGWLGSLPSKLKGGK